MRLAARCGTGFQPAPIEPWPATAADPCNNVLPRSRDHRTGEFATSVNIRSGRTWAFAIWADVTGVAMAA